jgi:hypothetical protein
MREYKVLLFRLRGSYYPDDESISEIEKSLNLLANKGWIMASMCLGNDSSAEGTGNDYCVIIMERDR